ESRVFQIAETRANKYDGPKGIEEILSETVEKIEQLYQKPLLFFHILNLGHGAKRLHFLCPPAATIT
ncbi:MAG: hypothetical protein ACTS8H_01830, partial [Arsenophonus sp. NC-PE1-MAG3]